LFQLEIVKATIHNQNIKQTAPKDVKLHICFAGLCFVSAYFAKFVKFVFMYARIHVFTEPKLLLGFIPCSIHTGFFFFETRDSKV